MKNAVKSKVQNRGECDVYRFGQVEVLSEGLASLMVRHAKARMKNDADENPAYLRRAIGRIANTRLQSASRAAAIIIATEHRLTFDTMTIGFASFESTSLSDQGRHASDAIHLLVADPKTDPMVRQVAVEALRRFGEITGPRVYGLKVAGFSEGGVPIIDL